MQIFSYHAAIFNKENYCLSTLVTRMSAGLNLVSANESLAPGACGYLDNSD
jgi:hypothetical protein